MEVNLLRSARRAACRCQPGKLPAHSRSSSLTAELLRGRQIGFIGFVVEVVGLLNHNTILTCTASVACNEVFSILLLYLLARAALNSVGVDWHPSGIALHLFLPLVAQTHTAGLFIRHTRQFRRRHDYRHRVVFKPSHISGALQLTIAPYIPLQSALVVGLTLHWFEQRD